ncbi:transposase domain-containing protein [Mastigocladopsis repens]|uniref:transposase domain-containing protein n=1 Tax=Mastigocladopsis repens TaxID=221287 RepID=UPI0003609708|nr:transposase domain-containing protein [Mastigocladopsis repens]
MSLNIQSPERFNAIETAIPVASIEQAIAKTEVEEERNRSLPAQIVVGLIIAMSLSPLKLDARCTKAIRFS